MKKSIRLVCLAFVLLTILTSCGIVSTPAPPAAILPPTSTATPPSSETVTPVPPSTATRKPTHTATPWPSRADTGMGGNLTISGVVKDDSGNAVPGVYVVLTVYGAEGGWDFGRMGHWGLYTDADGIYSFEKVIRLKSGHYEIWFNGEHEYGKAFENSGHHIEAHRIRSNDHILNMTVHAVTGSVFSGKIQYEDADGSIKDFYSPPFTMDEPGHSISLVRGNPDNIEYAIGGEYGRLSNGRIEWRGLAGGIYYLEFIYRRLDGVLMRCNSPVFEIPTGGTKQLEYLIRNCSPSSESVIP